MSLYVFLALCILGTGFMTYAFFQWTYGDKHGAGVRQIAAHKKAFREQSHRPCLVPSQGACLVPQELPHLVGQRVNRSRPSALCPGGAPSTNDSLEHYAKRFCDHGE